MAVPAGRLRRCHRSRLHAAHRRRSAWIRRSSPTAPRRRSRATAPRSSPTAPEAVTAHCASCWQSVTASTAGNVFVTTGGLQGFAFWSAAQLAAQARRVLVEGPTYDRPLKLLGWQGAEVVSLPMDGEGLDLDALATELAQGRRRLVPLHDPDVPEPERAHAAARAPAPSDRARRRARARHPRGRSLRPRPLRGRGAAASARARRRRAGARSRRRSRRPSRPGLRVGWFVVPEALRASFDDRAVSTYISPPLLPQAIVHELHARGGFEPNLERITGLLRARQTAMLGALEREMPDGVYWSHPEGGYFLWIDLPTRDGRRRSAPPGDGRRRHVRQGRRLLPGGWRGSGLGAPRLQLRDARADRRRRRDPRVVL